MRTAIGLVMLAAVGLGCGGSPLEETDELTGTEWGGSIGRYCAGGMVFGELQSWRHTLLCLQPDGENWVAMESETGSYSVSGETVTLHTITSTCPAGPTFGPGQFSITNREANAGGKLSLETPIGATTYVFVLAGDGTSTTSPVKVGCFNSEQVFVESH